MTVQPQGSTTFNVSVVVYYGRGFIPDEEQVYGVPPNKAVVLNPVPNPTLMDLAEGARMFNLSWTTSADAPYLKRGGWVLDVEGGYWYQIENYTPIEGVLSSNITLTGTAVQRSRLMIFPRGVVDVYPIKLQSP